MRFPRTWLERLPPVFDITLRLSEAGLGAKELLGKPKASWGGEIHSNRPRLDVLEFPAIVVAAC